MSRTYGHDKTIHQNGEVDVELDEAGNVVAVWFRCQPLPFTQNRADSRRAEEMRRMYSDESSLLPGIVAVELND